MRYGWTEEMHGHGDHGMYVYRMRRDDSPRLTITIRCEKHGQPEVIIYFVDGKPLPTWDYVAAALAQPHDLAGIADRLNERISFNRRKAVWANDTLTVYGERRAGMEKRWPHFEGVPIVWTADPPPEVPSEN